MDSFRGDERGDNGGFYTPASSRGSSFGPPLHGPTNIYSTLSSTSTKSCLSRSLSSHLPISSKTLQKKIKPLPKEATSTTMPPLLAPPSSNAIDQVKTLIQDFKANRRRPILAVDEEREFEISLEDWYKLRDEFNLKEDRYFFECSYDTSKSILTIKGPPSDVHEAVVEFLAQNLNRSISLTAPVRVRTTGQVSCDEGQYMGSEKIPDLAIFEKDSRKNWKIKWALEVGFSENYEKLKSDVELLLKGKASEMIQCALVKIVETPKYRCPISNEEEIDLQDWKEPRMFEAMECHGEEYGPMFYQGRQWVGEISNIFWETWQLDVETNEVKQLRDVMTALVLTRYEDWYKGRQQEEGSDPKDQDYTEEEEKDEDEDKEGRKVKKRRLNPSQEKKIDRN
ncbi:hypothetical protein LTS17_008523 [Exophiala oligosperma]